MATRKNESLPQTIVSVQRVTSGNNPPGMYEMNIQLHFVAETGFNAQRILDGTVEQSAQVLRGLLNPTAEYRNGNRVVNSVGECKPVEG